MTTTPPLVRSGVLIMDSSSTKSSTPIPSWGVNMVESHGDYREEAFLEQLIGGRLYSNQVAMPRLPIPTMEQTLQRFLPTALPLARNKDEEAKLKEACLKFPEQAQELQSRLMERRNGEFRDSSWLQLWWNQMGYLQVRDPVVVNVSYFFSFVDDPTIHLTPKAMPNVQRGAAMLFAAAEFRKMVITGQFGPEVIGKKKQTPLCATAYKYMFNACRVPCYEQDVYRIYDPSLYTHCIVARKGHFFAIELVHPQSGNPLPLSQFEDQLADCIRKADTISSSSRNKVGLLTSQNRDSWASARQELLTIGGLAMISALERLESGALLLNLDDEAPVSRQECGDLFWTGGLKSGENRWFDKSIQIMISNNGKAGLIAEHSMMDGMPVINFANYITSVTYSQAKRKSIHQQDTYRAITVPEVEDIFGDSVTTVNSTPIGKLVDDAWSAFYTLITDHVLHVQSFQGYGSSFIKKCRFPPDAFVQVAMQLATYRLFGEQVGTYEATQVRSFLHGRTDVTRAVSIESECFIKRMDFRPLGDENDPKAFREKLSLLRAATTAHVKFTGLAAKAQGVDRHFMGLSLLVKDGEKMPDLFSNPLYARSKHWRSSTSNLSHPRFNLWGYGEVVPDGVGLAYAILPNSCVFNITALRSTGYTDKLSELLEEALLEMKGLVEIQLTGDARSKL